jgi:hypothetical protein
LVEHKVDVGSGLNFSHSPYELLFKQGDMEGELQRRDTEKNTTHIR